MQYKNTEINDSGVSIKNKIWYLSSTSQSANMYKKNFTFDSLPAGSASAEVTCGSVAVNQSLNFYYMNSESFSFSRRVLRRLNNNVQMNILFIKYYANISDDHSTKSHNTSTLFLNNLNSKQKPLKQLCLFLSCHNLTFIKLDKIRELWFTTVR